MDREYGIYENAYRFEDQFNDNEDEDNEQRDQTFNFDPLKSLLMKQDLVSFLSKINAF